MLKEDTLKTNVLDKLCHEYIIGLNNMEKATACADAQLKLSQQINYKKGIAEGFPNYGSIYRNRGDFGPVVHLCPVWRKAGRYTGDRDKTLTGIVLLCFPLPSSPISFPHATMITRSFIQK
jgi:hypothetical protein